MPAPREFSLILTAMQYTCTCTLKPVYKGQLFIKDTFSGPFRGLYEQLPFIYRLKLYVLFINEENETAEVPFIDSDLLYRGAL